MFYHFLFAVSLGNLASGMSEKIRLDRKIGFQNTFYTKCINVIIDSIGPSIILRSIFLIGLKPHFLAFLPVQRKKLNFQQELLKKTVIFSGILTGCIDKSIIKVNVGSFNL